MLHQSQKSLLALKSWLFTPATKSDRFSRAAEVKADALIIDLEDAVAPTAKEEARLAALRYLGEISSNHLPCALRVNSPDTRFGLDDLQALLLSPAEPEYLILPKCDSSALISLVGNLLREANKSTQVIALIESTKAIGALAEMVSGQGPDRLYLRCCGYGCGPRCRNRLGATTVGEVMLDPCGCVRWDCRFRLPLF